MINLYYRVLCLVVFLSERVFGTVSPEPIRMGFGKVRFFDGKEVKGDIMATKMKVGEWLVATIVPRDEVGSPASYQEGSAVWTQLNDAAVTVEVNPENELEAKITCVRDTPPEVVTVEAHLDGDPDDDESREIFVSGTILCDARNEAVSADMVLGEVQSPETPVEGGEGEEV